MRPFASRVEACKWVASLRDWYKQRDHHSNIKFDTPYQRHSGTANNLSYGEPMSTRRPTKPISGAGADQRAAGGNRSSVDQQVSRKAGTNPGATLIQAD